MGKRDLIFLSYASEDLVRVSKIYKHLKDRNLPIWFDKVDIVDGKWLSQIERAINHSRFFLFCLSEASIRN